MSIQFMSPGTTPIAGDSRTFAPEFVRWFREFFTFTKFAVVPVKGVIMCSLTAAEIAAYFDGTGLGLATGPYRNWAVCNGSNGTPNLDGRFVRCEVSAAGATGGSDTSAHTHDIDHNHAPVTTGAESGHTHSTPAHSHAAGTLTANINIGAGFVWNDVINSTDLGANAAYTPEVRLQGTQTSDTTAQGNATVVKGNTATDGSGTSGASSGHTHLVDLPALGTTQSGAASNTENRPAYYELVPVMRLR